MPGRALQLFEGMQQLGLPPNVVTCAAVICAGGLTLHLLDGMWQQGLQLIVITYSAVINAGGKCARPEGAW